MKTTLLKWSRYELFETRVIIQCGTYDVTALNIDHMHTRAVSDSARGLRKTNISLHCILDLRNRLVQQLFRLDETEGYKYLTEGTLIELDEFDLR